MEKKKNTFEEIWEAMKKSRNILMSLHPKPDGDSLGSCTALKKVLEQNGKKVSLFSKDDISENLKGFNFTEEVRFGKSFDDYDLKDFDTIIFLDYGTLGDYTEKIKRREFPKGLITINIDHHDTNSYFGDLNYVNPKITSCCSILVDFFKDINLDFDKDLSRRLLLGILTDSGFFLNDKSPDSMEKAVFLIEKGKINYPKEFYEPIMNNPWKVKKLIGKLIENMEKTKISGKNVAYSYILQKDIKKLGLNSAEIRLGINFLKDIKDIDVIFTLSEMEDDIKGSFRSNGVDTTLFSTEFGGGGHKEASAFYLEKIPMDKAIEKVLDTIEKVGIHKA